MKPGGCAALFVAVLLGGSGWMAAQQPNMPPGAQPVFEVATIKPTPPDERNQGFQVVGTHIRLLRQTVASMVMFAYGIHSRQIVGAPEWVASQAFTVDGIPDTPGEPNLAQFQHLVQQLLADRFGLRTHTDKRELSYYALRSSPGGPKLVASTHSADTPDQTGNGGPKGQTMTFTNNNMAEFALGMQYFADRPVVDETQLHGRYDFTLQWLPDSMTAPVADAAPNLFTALREELGLEFKPAKGPVDVLVVDAVTKPSEN